MDRQKLLALAGIVLIAAAALIFMLRRGGETPQASDMQVTLSTKLAEAALAELGQPSGSLLVINFVMEGFWMDPFLQNAEETLMDSARKKGWKVILEKLKISPNLESTGETVEKAVFLDALRRHPEVQAAVSLIGLPKIMAADLAAVKPWPKMVVATTFGVPHLAQLPKGTYTAALLLTGKPMPADGSDTRLEDYFQTIRPKP